MASREHLFNIFNQFLRLARTAKLQYEQHLTVIDHEPAQSILGDIIADENQHIQWLVTAIEDAGGRPTAETYELAVPEEYEHMMRADYDIETSIVNEYELHLEEIWDPQLRSLANVILEQARQHQEAFRGLFEDFGTDELMNEIV
ncbi:MAG TPA: ferritin-like domain-containing protein [Anaerolineae bacterium]|jgi:rubrerythrin|nr:ferritin-like domain-containing protein [Anaerolineae bacterium]